jgi:hypothetical protein
MSSFIDKLLEKKGMTRADIHPNSNVGQIFRQRGVRYTPELERVLALPRRQWGDEELATLLTEEYRRPGGTMKLRPAQAAALAEIHDCGGLLGAMRVGSGKTLCTFLAPKVLGSKRPLLLIPAKLKIKTERDWLQLQKHWILPEVRVESYELLGRADHHKLLDNYAPDLIIADECHRLKNTKASSTRKLARYLKEHPGVPFMGLSGTITGRSLHEYWHILRWSHREKMPLPLDWSDMSEWADALDVKADGVSRTSAGALVAFCTPEEAKVLEYGGDVSIQAVRRAYQRRLVDTPGVISTGGDQVACSLSITEKRLDLNHLSPYFAQLRDTWCTADGWPFSEAVDLWRHAREMVVGMYSKWDPRPPESWLAVRRAWCKFVRDSLSHSRSLDSELQVLRAVKTGELSDGGLLAEWTAVRPTFEPNTVAIWIDDTVLKYCSEWLKTNKGLVWTEHTAFGRRLAKLSGFPYYGRAGLSDDGRNVEDEQGSCILSIAANSEGRNMQRFSKCLIPSCPPNGARLEQLIGRCHRDGQEADEVEIELILACREQYAGFLRALADAKYTQDSTGASQKLLFADITISNGQDGGPLWR